MKKVMIPLLCLVLSGITVTHAQEAMQNNTTGKAATTDAGVFKFKELVHDYGEVPEGPLAEYDFVFKNKGKKPIIISNAVGSCGCTTAGWPHEPILPGKKGKIHVMYNTDHRPGTINKQVTVTSNASEPSIVLSIKGTVNAKPVDVAANK